VVGNGFDERGREMLSFIDGDFVHPAPWSEDALPALGALLRRLHDCGAHFSPPSNAVWRPWYGRDLSAYRRVFGHGDLGPWNIVSRDGLPVALIDWETAGPMDAMVELGQACWLNAQLHDDDVAQRVGLASPADRARHAALIADGYGLARRHSRQLVQAMIDVATADAADQAIEAGVTPDSTDPTPLWG
jgi:Ser/Thr protein kinase RdoA (MazF antagonist)